MNEVKLCAHIIDRWHERFPEEMEGKNKQEIDEYIMEYIKDSYPVLTSKDPETKQLMTFLYKDFKVIIYCIDTSTAITVIPTDYNHTEDIDKMIANKLYKDILDIDNSINIEKEMLEQEVMTINSDIDSIDDQMKKLQKQLDKLKTTKYKLNNIKEEKLKSFEILMTDRDRLGRQLAYSVSYRMENKANDLKRLDTIMTSVNYIGASKRKGKYND